MATPTIQSRLARSLDQANQREADTAAHTQAEIDRLRRDYLAKVIPLTDQLQEARPAAIPTGRGCVKLSVSLFPGDVARLDAIRDLMARHGVRLSTSQAVKLALRTAPLDVAALRQALDAIRLEDGRKW